MRGLNSAPGLNSTIDSASSNRLATRARLMKAALPVGIREWPGCLRGQAGRPLSHSPLRPDRSADRPRLQSRAVAGSLRAIAQRPFVDYLSVTQKQRADIFVHTQLSPAAS